MKKCIKCSDSFLKISGPHIGEYCKICGSFIRWISKEESERIKRLAEFEKEPDITEEMITDGY